MRSKQEFAECLGEKLSLRLTTGQAVEIELAEVNSLKTFSARATREPFSLIFLSATHLPQRTYEVEHQKLGRFDIFLVPVGPHKDGRGLQMEAIFNFCS